MIQVEALEEWFKPHTDVSAIAIDFDTGDQVKLGPNKLSAEAKIDVPLEDVIVRKQRESEYGDTQITIRGTNRSARRRPTPWTSCSPRCRHRPAAEPGHL